jgi:hypothetical protein
VATSEPVVHHHGREGGGFSRDEVRPSVFNGLLGGDLDSVMLLMCTNRPRVSDRPPSRSACGQGTPRHRL